MRISPVAFLLASFTGIATAFAPSCFSCSSTLRAESALAAIASTRNHFLKQVASTVTAVSIFGSTTTFSPFSALADDSTVVTLPSGVSYTVVKSGTGPAPSIGELAAIRFKADVKGGNKIDDIFDTPEPYYTRVGSGGLLKGVEEVLPKMRVGDRWIITIPTNLAFGPKGRPSSAGKPRIPGDAIIIFEVEMVGLPGKEQELIDIIGDE